jgi:WD40 repeat protein
MKTGMRILIIFIIASAFLPLTHAIEPTWIYNTTGTTFGTPAITSDGSTIIVPAGKIFLFSKNGSLVAAEPYGSAVAMTPDGQNLVSSFASTVYFFRVSSSQNPADKKSLTKMWQYDFPDQIRSISISDDGTTILAATRSMGVYTFDTASTELASNDEDYNPIITFFGEDNTIIGISRDQVRIYNNALASLDAYEITTSSVPTTMILPRAGEFVIFNDGQRIRCVDNMGNGTELWNRPIPGPVSVIASTPIGYPIIIGTNTGYIDTFNLDGVRLWNYSSNPQKKQSSGITGIALSSEGKIIAAGTFDGKIIWFDSNGDILGSYIARDYIRHIAVSSDGSMTIATGDEAIYAFSSASLQSPYEERQVANSSNSTIDHVTVSQTLDESTESTHPISPEILEESSVIRTPTKSAQFGFAGILAVLLAIMIFYQRK